MNSKWLETRKCVCGCGKVILKYGSDRMPRSYVRGHHRAWLGKKRSVETKKKISESRKGKLMGKDNHFSRIKFKGKEHKLWKGDKVGYYALHTWVQRELGKPSTCEFCGATDLKGQFIQWANKSKKYKRDLKDWLRLCAKCHYHYDRD